jgi:hypothetical protein
MATSNQSDERLCSFCDPSPIKAMGWCPECDDFLCSDCLRHHKSSKTSKHHSTMSLEDYKELPTVVQAMKHHCEDHDEPHHMYCPVHNRPCCIRCVLTAHKECTDVAPITDFISNVKSSPAILDLEQTLKELGSFVKRLMDDKDENLQEILTRKKEICEEIHKIRKSLNDHLDQLQETLIGSITKTVDDVTLQLGDDKNRLTEIENKASNITMEFIKIKEHASDLQTFLSLPHLVSKANDEEKKIEKLGSEGKFNRKSIKFTTKIDDIIKMKSIGDVGVDDIKSDVAYVKEKEKQAQIVGPLARRTSDDIILTFLKEIKVRTGNLSNKLTGCSILDNGEILFSEYNLHTTTHRVTLNDSRGNFIRDVTELNPDEGPFYDLTSIETKTAAVSTGTCINIVNIDTHKGHTFENHHTCYGITHWDGKLYFCSSNEGIRRLDLKTGISQFLHTNIDEWLIPTNMGEFSYISCDGNRLFYTSNTDTVACCDMNGKPIWSFKDTSLLRSPRGVVISNHGFVFVAGEKSGNIVVISPDGNSSKEVYQISSPRAMCYDKNNNTILVCNTGKRVFWFQVSLDA